MSYRQYGSVVGFVSAALVQIPHVDASYFFLNAREDHWFDYLFVGSFRLRENPQKTPSLPDG